MGSDCCADTCITSGAFAETLLRHAPPGPAFPVCASLELTTRCNLRCRHCYLPHDSAIPPDRSTREVEQTLETLRDFGVLFLVLTGGEPFARPDFRDVYTTAKRLGFFLTLFSNGTLLTNPLMDFLTSLPPRRLELTTYGHTEATYEAVTGVPGSYRRFRQAVDGLLQRGLLVRLKSMILQTNAHEREAMRDWATGLGCDFRYDAIVHPCVNGDPRPLAERLPAATIAQFLHRDRTPHTHAAASDSTAPRQRLLECGAGLLTVHIDAQHQAHPCIAWRMDPFDLTRRPPLTTWQAHITEVRNRPAPGGHCDTCERRARCQSCAAYALLETGSAAGTPTFFCSLT